MNIGSMSIMQNGIRGFQNAQSLINRSTADLAHLNVTHSSQNPEASEADEVSAIRSPEESIAALKQGEIYARAGAKVISAGYDTIGTLLDIRV